MTMASLDDVLDALRHYRHTLVTFDAALAQSHAQLRKHHDAIDGLWHDEASRRYHLAFEPLDSFVSTYLTNQAPQLEAFIGAKLGQLEHYLQGGDS